MEIEIHFIINEKNFETHGRTNFYFDEWSPNKVDECIENTKKKINNDIIITIVHVWPRNIEETKNPDCIPVCGA